MYLLLRDDLRDPLLRTPGCGGRASALRRPQEKRNATRPIKHHLASGCSPVLSVRRAVALVPAVAKAVQPTRARAPKPGRPAPRASRTVGAARSWGRWTSGRLR